MRPKHCGHRQRPKKQHKQTLTLTIDRLGAQGDGLAGDTAIPFTLPGEEVEVNVQGKQGQVISLLSASPDRQSAVCSHFGIDGGQCGGCKLQHLGLDASLQWKADRLKTAIRRTIPDVPDPDCYQSALQSRRRAKLILVWNGASAQIGFHALRHHHIVPFKECHILTPDVFQIALRLKDRLPRLLREKGGQLDLFITQTDEGMDVDLSSLDEEEISLEQREGLAQLVYDLDLARLTVAGVPMAERRAPAIHFGDVHVELAPGGFLQATRDGEKALQQIVCQAAEGFSVIADLFSGAGTFTFPLSEKGTVTAIDSDGPAISALEKAAKRSGRSITARRQDLFTAPLVPEELRGVDAVVMDPPRAGAEAQAEQLVKSSVRRVIAVSCNPHTLARDAQILSGRYHLTSLHLVDQFLYSSHIECVAVFDAKPGNQAHVDP